MGGDEAASRRITMALVSALVLLVPFTLHVVAETCGEACCGLCGAGGEEGRRGRGRMAERRAQRKKERRSRSSPWVQWRAVVLAALWAGVLPSAAAAAKLAAALPPSSCSTRRQPSCPPRVA